MERANELSATAVAKAIRDKRLTSEELVAACLERITAREEAVGAWVHIDPEAALAQARARDGETPTGALHGVPIGIKDIIDTVDMPTEYGSPIYAGHRPAWDAACVGLLRRAGAVILGKTVTTEFAGFTPRKTKNPHNPAHTPGGSSSGSAAGVADCMMPLAIGSQTGGSVIRPSSFCGVVGYKPTYGEISLAGVKMLSLSNDTLGTHSRAVADAALLRNAFVAAPANVIAIERPPRFGLCRTAQWPDAQAEAQHAVEAAAESLARAGAEVCEVSLPSDFTGLIEANTTTISFESWRAFAYEWAAHREQLSEKFCELSGEGETISYGDYCNSLALAERCRRRLGDVFADVDALLTPSTPGEAPHGLEATGNPLFNKMWTLLGTPAVTLPGHTGPNGLPVGVQLIGPVRGDDRLLSVAAWAENRIV